ncbi:TetR/AcrR family transcriptional regulator [Salipaludibacillus agaradhaerens]|jgi:probable dihydroxyacetone kinase regulator|uniref:TetR/AcrR family transcriptional regulator n=1 Tax=Salipaludibacillus agaradhaerens TaxID=76935 RepID=A0A9Q4B3P3_SALAG|nr:TetR/AcrR family transcriptional regulator [Salipaludibacillus agaradhaerens]MCR6097691.1 TetR/AcrR family transcriptional regulator [Salipaludibacillus agaradhaerens]MCR6112825.1 TetR/AcrR family transcriptional regulator [Salipaludibacillus agaradhaerens]
MSHRTKKALAFSLKKLLEQTTLEKITVKDIVKECGVNRQTFYYHFHDIYELLEWLFRTEVTEVIDNKNTYETWQQGFLRVLNYIETNKKIVMNTYHSLEREHLEEYLYRFVYSLMIDVINEQAKGIRVTEENKQFIADFYKYAFVGIVIEWIGEGMKECPEMISDNLSKLIDGDITKALLYLQK